MRCATARQLGVLRSCSQAAGVGFWRAHRRAQHTSATACKHRASQEGALRAGENNVNGFGLEFYIETPADEIAETIHDVKKSWQFQLLYTVSQLAAGAFAGLPALVHLTCMPHALSQRVTGAVLWPGLATA